MFESAQVLLVEDSPTQAMQVGRLLEQEGMTVRYAADADHVLVELNRDLPDLILLDDMLPGMTGDELCRTIRLHLRTRAVPILMLTASTDAADLEQTVRESDADDFLDKSEPPEVLMLRVRALLRRRFRHQENERIVRDLSEREHQALQARAAQAAAEEKAAMADRLETINRQLAAANKEQREAQAQLIQQAKMAALGELVAGVAHEINNPIAFVTAHRETVARQLEQLALSLADGLDPNQRRRLDKARRRLADMKLGLDRVTELVSKLRTFSRLDEGEIKTVDIHESLEAVLLLLQHRTRSHIELARDYLARGPVECYPGPLNQVLMNVITNAIDAIGDEPGRIELHTAESEGGRLEIRVCDSGSGIPEGIRQRVFEPFFTTKPVGSGTGLGLAISYRIMQNHGGAIDLRKAESGGTEVIIRLPLQQTDTSKREA